MKSNGGTLRHQRKTPKAISQNNLYQDNFRIELHDRANFFVLKRPACFLQSSCRKFSPEKLQNRTKTAQTDVPQGFRRI